MNWDAIGAIAELLAAIGVIISLVFVGLQVRKSNDEARAATMQATTDTEMSMIAVFADNAEVWDKVNTAVELEDGTEMRKGILLFNLLMMDYENRFHQFQAGYIDSPAWGRRVALLHYLKSLPIYKYWRASPGGKSRGSAYLEFIDGIEADPELVND